jgi:hypothetical protein
MVLLCLLVLLLLLNITLPQEAVLGQERFAALVDNQPVKRFFLVTLGMGKMSVSPIFVAALGLFFLNLTAVLLARIGPTWRRIALRPRAEEGLKAWTRMEESFGGTLPETFGANLVARVLRGFGFQVRRVGDRTFWAVKHRTAPLGFLVFHFSFFLLCAGGVLLYYSRFVGVATLTEGQGFEGDYSQILRSPPTGSQPDLRFTVERIETRLERGEPVHLSATLRVHQAGPAATLPALWIQDERGFTLDRVVVAAKTRSQEPTLVPMAEGRFSLIVSPLGPNAAFPSRDQLARTRLHFELLSEKESLWSGWLQPGEGASFEGGRLVLEELRYWVGVRVVSERGGGLLIAGFTAGIVGLIWRLLWYRREVAVTWDTSEFRLVGRSEYFSDRFRRELVGIFQTLQRGGT